MKWPRAEGRTDALAATIKLLNPPLSLSLVQGKEKGMVAVSGGWTTEPPFSKWRGEKEEEENGHKMKLGATGSERENDGRIERLKGATPSTLRDGVVSEQEEARIFIPVFSASSFTPFLRWRRKGRERDCKSDLNATL